MKTPAGSIRNLLVIISVIAADCSLVHNCLADESYLPFDGWPAAFRLGFFGSAIMANLEVVGGSMLLPRPGDGRPFLTGFVIAGAVSILVVQGIAAVIPHAWCIPLARAINTHAAKIHPSLGFGLTFSDFLEVSFFFTFSVLILLPELLIASMGGLLARRLAGRAPRWGTLPGLTNVTPI
jgi:hypothetical protein